MYIGLRYQYITIKITLIPENEISALISLLDDPDDFVYNEVKNKLLSLGDDVIPVLESYWENNPLNNDAMSRIEDIIQKIQYDTVYEGLKKWKDKENPSLLEGILLINKYQYPDLDSKAITEKLEQIKRDIWIEINNELTAFEKVNVVNQVLFHIYEFSGNKKNYHSPKNSFLSNVLETKKGNPLSLAIIYLLVTQELGLPIYGVNLPSHFVLAYMDENIVNPFVDDENKEDVLFYINPFSRGTIFNKKEIESFLTQLNLPQKPEYFEPCTPIIIIRRVLNNLGYSYEKLGYKSKMEDMEKLLAIFKDSE